MKLTFLKYSYLSILLIVLPTFQSLATHLVGGYAYYTRLQNLPNGKIRYQLVLEVFRDCSKLDNAPFDDEIKIGIHNDDANKTLREAVDFKMVGSPKKVRPPGNTQCDIFDNELCIEQATYRGIIDIEPSNVGNHLTWIRCCRNFQDNLTDAGTNPNQGQTYYSYIYSTELENSSPRFSGIPAPYMCVNDTVEFLFNAFDLDGDSLVYEIMRPYSGGSISANHVAPDPANNLDWPINTVIYEPGYSETQPFGANGYINVDAATGLTTVFSPNVGSFVVGVKVTEYRNGIRLGESRLDLQIKVIPCPVNNRPELTSNAPTPLEVVAGEEICFNVAASDRDANDFLRIRAFGDILDGRNGYEGSLASFPEVTGASVLTGEFCWTPDCDAARDETYQVVFEAFDNGCPPKNDKLKVDIKVLPHEGATAIAGPDTICSNSFYKYYVVDASPNSSFQWFINNGEFNFGETQDTIYAFWYSSGAKQLKFLETTENGCIGDTIVKNVFVNSGPVKPFIVGKDTVCFNSLEEYSVSFNLGSTYSWQVNNGNIISNNNNRLEVEWNQLGNQLITVTETNEFGCSSIPDSLWVNVRTPLPQIRGAQSVCPNTSGWEYLALGDFGSNYTWVINGGVISGSNIVNPVTVNWGDSGQGVIAVIEIDRFGCQSNQAEFFVDKEYNLKNFIPIGDSVVCEFDQGLLYSTYGRNALQFDWGITGGNIINGLNTQEIEVNWGSAGMGEIRLQVFDFDPVNNQSCQSDLETLPVRIAPLPRADEIIGDFDLCASDEINFYNINGYPNSHFLWRINNDSSNINGQGSNTIGIQWQTAGTFNLSVFETSIDGCTNEIIDSNIIVRPIPTTLAISGQSFFCLDDLGPSTYAVQGFNNSQFNWFTDQGQLTTANGLDSISVEWTGINPSTLSVQEVSEYGCLGDTQFFYPYFQNLTIDLRRVTVLEGDQSILLNWQFPNSQPNDNITIERSDYNSPGAWQNIATIPDNRKSFVDNNVDADANRYTYRIRTNDLCQNTIISEEHTQVLVDAFRNEENKIGVNFSDYLGWDAVNRYELFLKIGDQSYQTLGIFSTSQNSFMLDSLINSSSVCFKVSAYEESLSPEYSNSNEVCLFFNPVIFVPNAFSPNGDGTNDFFKPIISGAEEYEMIIFNRWGEEIWKTNDINEAWNGTYKDQISATGVYAYVINYKDFNYSSYRLSGIVHLLR